MIFIFDDKNEPADIFAEIPSEKAPPPPPGGQRPTGTTPLTVGESGVILESAPFVKKWVIIIVVLVLLIGGGAAAYFFFLRGKTGTPPIEQPAPQPQPEPEPQPAPEPEPATTTEPAPEPEPPVAETDTDGDGLSDAREGQLGTDPGKVDTDDDGLSDREEVEVYHTDPLNFYFYFDTFKDGDEVRAGYDPNGPGRLLLIPPPIP